MKLKLVEVGEEVIEIISESDDLNAVLQPSRTCQGHI